MNTSPTGLSPMSPVSPMISPANARDPFPAFAFSPPISPAPSVLDSQIDRSFPS